MPEVLVPNRRLGWKGPKFPAELVALDRYMDLGALPAPPPSLNLIASLSALGMMLNDQLGDCTCAEVGHFIQSLTFHALGSEVTLPDSVIEALYQRFGYVPGDPSTDQGAVISDVLQVMSGPNPTGHTYEQFGSIAPKNDALVYQTIWLFGGLDAGVSLPAAAQSFDTVWDIPAGQPLTGEWEPNSWGGHCVYVGGYDSATGDIFIVTWGKMVRVTKRFRDAYFTELWAVVSRDWLNKNGVSPDGAFNDYQLQVDLATIEGKPLPPPPPTPTPPPPPPPPTPTPPAPTPPPVPPTPKPHHHRHRHWWDWFTARLSCRD